MKIEVWIGDNIGIVIDGVKKGDLELVQKLVRSILKMFKENKDLIIENIVFEHINEDSSNYVG